MLAGRIDHIQSAWTKLGFSSAAAVLQGGADDLGGILLDGVLNPRAGAEAGRSLRVADARSLAASIGRIARQRTTLYEAVEALEHVDTVTVTGALTGVNDVNAF